MNDEVANVHVRPARGPARAVVLVLHGGAEASESVVRPWRLAYVRMVPFARSLHAVGAKHGLAVWQLRNRVHGWNEPRLDPVADARWALAGIRERHAGLPVVLVGHSMGGRVALRVADDPAVVGVCALAPWTPAEEPVAAVRDKDVLIVHGTGDRMTDPAQSYDFAVRAAPVSARLARVEVAGEGHAMLRRPAVWARLTRDFTLTTLAVPGADTTVADVWTKPAARRLRIPL